MRERKAKKAWFYSLNCAEVRNYKGSQSWRFFGKACECKLSCLRTQHNFPTSTRATDSSARYQFTPVESTDQQAIIQRSWMQLLRKPETYWENFTSVGEEMGSFCSSPTRDSAGRNQSIKEQIFCKAVGRNYPNVPWFYLPLLINRSNGPHKSQTANGVYILWLY